MSMFTVDWFTAHVPTWEHLLVPRFAGRAGLRVLEIGSYEGRSACWLMEHVVTGEGASLTCVDPWAPYSDQPRTDLRTGTRVDLEAAERRFDENTQQWWPGPGRDPRVEPTLRKRRMPGWRFLCRAFTPHNLIYVDGSHEALAALEDVVLSWRALATNGVLVFDDYNLDISTLQVKPARAIDAFVSCLPEHAYQVLHKGKQVILEKL